MKLLVLTIFIFVSLSSDLALASKINEPDVHQNEKDALASILGTYKDLASLKAEIRQKKYSKYLIRPLESQLSFAWKHNLLIWHIKTPKELKIVVENGVVNMDFGANSGQETPPQATPLSSGVAIFIQSLKVFIDDLLQGNLAKLEEAYKVSVIREKVRGSEVKNVVFEPIIASVTQLFSKLAIRFAGANLIEKIIIYTGEEDGRTELEFSNLVKLHNAEMSSSSDHVKN